MDPEHNPTQAGDAKMETEEIPKSVRKWPGLVLSLFIPGFGLIRAGLYARGVLWFVGLYLASLLSFAAFASEFIPLAVTGVAIVGGIALQVWMYCDSYRGGRMTWTLWGLFGSLLLLVLFVPSPAGFVASCFKVPTHSMEPTLMGSTNGSTPDHFVVNRLSYAASKPKRGDIVVFSASSIPRIANAFPAKAGEVLFAERIVGLPGERIEIKEGSVFANGMKLGPAEGIPSVEYTTLRGDFGVAIGNDEVVGENQYFVLGDNSHNSSDSRVWGCVPASSIIGKITRIYFPFNRIGAPE